ncbi:hypothetical protein M569_00190 [Genlisea aurea]|uniref:Uncharacterized protein n=1 Tax=Genlisea aurea TaxID=192259 RepID=S8EEZ0_9LAMI|nr:hypothetical protein M569_00190 [Genlisea aurea]
MGLKAQLGNGNAETTPKRRSREHLRRTSYSDERLAMETNHLIAQLQHNGMRGASFKNKQKLRMENAQQEEKIQCQNREALKNMICPTCGVPPVTDDQFKHGAADLPASPSLHKHRTVNQIKASSLNINSPAVDVLRGLCMHLRGG